MKQRFFKSRFLIASASSLTLFAGCQATTPTVTQPSASPSSANNVLPMPTPAPEVVPAVDFGFVSKPHGFGFANGSGDKYDPANPSTAYRSEERRVGKECR